MTPDNRGNGREQEAPGSSDPLLSMDPNHYEVSEPELLRGLRLF
jgi:hypothetical protein